MNHRICDKCDFNITREIEEFLPSGDYLKKNNIHYNGKDFCDEDCRKEYHDENCDDYYKESDQVSSTCLNCGYHSEHSEL